MPRGFTSVWDTITVSTEGVIYVEDGVGHLEDDLFDILENYDLARNYIHYPKGKSNHFEQKRVPE